MTLARYHHVCVLHALHSPATHVVALVSTCVGTDDIYFSRRPDAPAYVSLWKPKQIEHEIDIGYHDYEQTETDDLDQLEKVDVNQNESFRTELEIYVSDSDRAKLESEMARDRTISIPFETDLVASEDEKVWVGSDTEAGEELVMDVVAEEVAGLWLNWYFFY